MEELGGSKIGLVVVLVARAVRLLVLGELAGGVSGGGNAEPPLL